VLVCLPAASAAVTAKAARVKKNCNPNPDSKHRSVIVDFWLNSLSPPSRMSEIDKRRARAVSQMASRNKHEVGRWGLDGKLYQGPPALESDESSRFGFFPGDARVTTNDHGMPPSAPEWGGGFYRKQVGGNSLYQDNEDADRRRLVSQGITIDPRKEAQFAKMAENGWNTPEGKEHCHGVDGLEYAVSRGVSGMLRQDHYGKGKGARQIDEQGRPITRCWFSAGYNKQLSYLYTPPHGMGDASSTAQYLADKAAKERHDLLTMKHSHDLPDGQSDPNPHADLPWAKSLVHTAGIPKPRTSPWQLKRAGGSFCGLSGSANAVSSWSKESRPAFAIHQVPEHLVVHHLKNFTDGNISRTCEVAKADGVEVGLVMKGQHLGMLGVCSLDAANTVPASQNPAENYCGSKSLSNIVASRGGARSLG